MDPLFTDMHEYVQRTGSFCIDPALLALDTITTNSTQTPITCPLTPALISATSISKMTPALTSSVDAATTLSSIVDASTPLVPTSVTGIDSVANAIPAAAAQPQLQLQLQLPILP